MGFRNVHGRVHLLQSTSSADFVFIAIGNTPNTQFIAEADPSALSKERTINVNEYLQVRASPPCGPKVG